MGIGLQRLRHKDRISEDHVIFQIEDNDMGHKKRDGGNNVNQVPLALVEPLRTTGGHQHDKKNDDRQEQCPRSFELLGLVNLLHGQITQMNSLNNDFARNRQVGERQDLNQATEDQREHRQHNMAACTDGVREDSDHTGSR